MKLDMAAGVCYARRAGAGVLGGALEILQRRSARREAWRWLAGVVRELNLELTLAAGVGSFHVLYFV
jgi:hypothetical protein